MQTKSRKRRTGILKLDLDHYMLGSKLVFLFMDSKLWEQTWLGELQRYHGLDKVSWHLLLEHFYYIGDLRDKHHRAFTVFGFSICANAPIFIAAIGTSLLN